MPATPITNEELNSLCSYLSATSYIYYPISVSFFKDLFTTGCRPSELLDISLWTIIDPTTIELQPKKSNDPRTFTPDELSTDLLFAIMFNVPPYQGLSLRQLSSVLKKILPVDIIQTTSKSAIDYMFRYNRVKTMHQQGLTDIQIQDIFGWSTPALSLSYRSATMYRDGPFIPDFTRVIADDIGDLLINHDHTFIEST